MPRKYGQDLSCATRRNLFLKHDILVNAPYVNNILANAPYVHKSNMLSNISHDRHNIQNIIFDLDIGISSLTYKISVKVHTLSKITSTNSVFDSTKTICLNLNIVTCSSELYFYNYIQKQVLLYYIKRRCSPILIFYVHFLMSILRIFDISLQPITITYKLQYEFQRNCILRHDYVALLQRLSLGYLKIIYALQFDIIIAVQHIQIFNILLVPFKVIILDIIQLFNILQYNINKLDLSKSRITGGGPSNIFFSEDLSQHSSNIKQNYQYRFQEYILTSQEAQLIQNKTELLFILHLPLSILASHISIVNMKLIASTHKIKFSSKIKSEALQKLISDHICQSCDSYTTVFTCIDLNEQSEKAKKLKTEKVKQYQALNYEKYKISHLESAKQYQTSLKGKANHLTAVKNHQLRIKSQFLPVPLSNSLQYQVISRFCKDTTPSTFQEAGCAVCGKLTLFTELQKLSDLKLDLQILCQIGVT